MKSLKSFFLIAVILLAITKTQAQEIIYAARTGNLVKIKELIEKGASLDDADDYKRTPLLLTCRESGNFEIAKLLIDKGANINARDIFGDTPITLAAWRGFEDIVNYLLDKNAEMPESGKDRITLLSYATDKRLWKLYQTMLSKGGDLFLLEIMDLPVLHWAAAGGSEKITGDLIEKRMLVNSKDFYGWTPLHYASYFGRTEVAKFLISKGSDINANTPLNESPLYLAIMENKKEVADILISSGADQKLPLQTNLSGPYFGQKLAGNRLELFAPGIISRLKGGHSNIVFSLNGEEALWTEWNLRDVGYSAGCVVWYSKIINGFWSLPKKILPFGDTPFYSSEGKKIFFLASLPVPPENKVKKGIWYFETMKDTLSAPKFLDFSVDSTGLYWQFSFDRNQNIYFSSDDGLFRSVYKNNKYLPIEKLSDIFHNDYKGMGPFISPDGSYIIFSSMDLPGTFGSMDLYIGYRNPDGTWTKPVNMGPNVNSESDEILPMVSGDGKNLFLRTQRNGVSGIYWINTKIIEELRPKE